MRCRSSRACGGRSARCAPAAWYVLCAAAALGARAGGARAQRRRIGARILAEVRPDELTARAARAAEAAEALVVEMREEGGGEVRRQSAERRLFARARRRRGGCAALSRRFGIVRRRRRRRGERQIQEHIGDGIDARARGALFAAGARDHLARQLGEHRAQPLLSTRPLVHVGAQRDGPALTCTAG